MIRTAARGAAPNASLRGNASCATATSSCNPPAWTIENESLAKERVELQSGDR
jgi:hypothetical protein